MKSQVNRISHAHICQVTGSNHLQCYFLIFPLNNLHSKSLRTKPDTFFSSLIFKMCNWICTESCGTCSSPLSFVHRTAIPVDFHLGRLQHSTPPPSPKSKVKIPQSIAQFCSQGTDKKWIPQCLQPPHGTETDGAGIRMPRRDGEGGHWERKQLLQGTKGGMQSSELGQVTSATGWAKARTGQF